jgi:DTW domain-containing protein
MQQKLCVCEAIKPFDNKTQVTVIMHHREAYKTTNTSRIAHLALKNSEIYLRGHKQYPLDMAGLFPEPESCYLLTLHERSQELTPELVSKLKLKHLVVPDGNWRQATKMGVREPVLGRMHWIKLSAGPLSEYMLRREHSPEGLATMEAMARALDVIEGPEVSEHLLKAFRLMVSRTLNTRPKNRQDQNLKSR